MPIVGTGDSPDVVAVVPTMGLDVERLSACIRALLEGSGSVRLAVVVILNSSTADPARVAVDGIRVETAGLNLGWAGGLQFGAHLTSSPYLWWMQDDVVVAPSALGALYSELHDSRAAVAAPVVVDDNGLVVAGSCGGVVNAEGVLLRWLPPDACPPDQLPDLTELSYLPSRGLLVKRSAFEEVDGPNTRLYPAQYVDVDFSFRLKDRGLVGVTVTDAHIRHSGSASTPSRFAQFLSSRHAQDFAARWFANHPPSTELYFPVHSLRPDDAAAERRPVNPAVPRELVDQVAQSASDSLAHLGRVFAAEMGQDAEVARLKQRVSELERSRSWRVTAPARWLADRLRRR